MSIFKLAVIGILLVALLSSLGAAVAWTVGNTIDQIRAAQYAVQQLDDTARQSGAAVCAGLVISDSCNVSQVQHKVSASPWFPSDTDLAFLLLLMFGLVIIAFVYAIARMYS